jgi:phosphatidylinositol phospholipase C delta
MGSYAYKYCMCFTRKFRSPDAQPPPDVRAAHLSYCCGSDPHGLRRFLSQVQGESPAGVDRVLATLAPTWAAHGIARLVTRSPAATAQPTLEEFFGFLFSSDLNPPIDNQVRYRPTDSATDYERLLLIQFQIIDQQLTLLPSSKCQLHSYPTPQRFHFYTGTPLGIWMGMGNWERMGWEIGRQRRRVPVCIPFQCKGRCSTLGAAPTFHSTTTVACS